MPSGLATILTLMTIPAAAVAQGCSHSSDPAYYEKMGFNIRRIEFRHPYGFFFMVRHRLDAIKESLPLVEGGPFDEEAYDQSFNKVRDIVKADSAFGADSPLKIVTTTARLDNCHEGPGLPLTVDVVYQVFSTDPLPAIGADTEEREAVVSASATTPAKLTSKPRFEIEPRFSYDHTRRGFGGADIALYFQNKIIDTASVSLGGSSSSRDLKAEVHGAAHSRIALMESVEYSAAYRFHELPVLNLRLLKSTFQGTVLGSSRQFTTRARQFQLRYGAAIEEGYQRANVTVGGNSRYGGASVFAGLMTNTRYSDLAVSFAHSTGGAGLSNLHYFREFGDTSYTVRFPGGSHRPWDAALRCSTGGISGSGVVLANDSFYGGNTVESIVPTQSWAIANGPIVRSIPTHRMAGQGTGGLAFFSTNTTIGKVLKAWPMIPEEVESSEGFDDAVRFAENSAETWFADDYESTDPAFLQVLAEYPPKLGLDLDAAQSVADKVRTGSQNAGTYALLAKVASSIKLGRFLIQTASDPTLRGADRSGRLRAWFTAKSVFFRLTGFLQELKSRVPAQGTEIDSVSTAIVFDLQALKTKLNDIHTGPAHADAVAKAAQDMARPRDVIDTLRHEANRFALSVFGLFDAGRLWPDPFGTRYAIGGGGRVSLVNVNFNLGYAVNPTPRPQLGQGRGALFFAITYTDLFR